MILEINTIEKTIIVKQDSITFKDLIKELNILFPKEGWMDWKLSIGKSYNWSWTSSGELSVPNDSGSYQISLLTTNPYKIDPKDLSPSCSCDPN